MLCTSIELTVNLPRILISVSLTPADHHGDDIFLCDWSARMRDPFMIRALCCSLAAMRAISAECSSSV